jgi:hypothetical protein
VALAVPPVAAAVGNVNDDDGGTLSQMEETSSVSEQAWDPYQVSFVQIKEDRYTSRIKTVYPWDTLYFRL